MYLFFELDNLAYKNNKNGSHGCLKTRQTCSRSVIFTSYARNVCLQRETQALRRWRHVANSTLNNSVIQMCSLVLDALFPFVDIRDLGARWSWRRAFRAYDVRMI